MFSRHGRHGCEGRGLACSGEARFGDAGRERLGFDGSGKSRLGQACMVWKSKAGWERCGMAEPGKAGRVMAGTDSLGKVRSGTDWKGWQAWNEEEGGDWQGLARERRHGLISLIHLLFF